MDFRRVPLRDDLHFKKQRRKKQAKSKRQQKATAAADFETIDGDAWLFTLAWYEGEPRKPKTIKSALDEYSEGDPFTFKRFIDFIFDNCGIIWRRGGKNAVKGIKCPDLWFYNLSYDAGCLIKELRSTTIDLAMDMEKVVIDAVTTQPVKIKRDKWGNARLTKEQRKMYLLELSYLPKKHLRLKPLGRLAEHTDALGTQRVRGAIDLWDIAQFYGMSLKAASKRAMDDGLIEQVKLDSIDASRMNEVQYRSDNYDEIKRYALIDAEVTLDLAWLKVQELESQGFRMTNPYSPASVAERALLDQCEVEPLDAMFKHHRHRVLAFWTAYTGGWFEAVSVGFKQGVRAFDLVSAYPYAMYHLPNPFEGYWSHGDSERAGEFLEWLDEREPFTLGVAECTVSFPDDLPIYPAAKMSRFGCVITPQHLKGWFVADEIAEFLKWGADIFIEEWYCHYPDLRSDNAYPLRPYIGNAYTAKYEQSLLKKSGSSKFSQALYDAAKLRSNSTYGKLIQAIRIRNSTGDKTHDEPTLKDLTADRMDYLDALVTTPEERCSGGSKTFRTGNLFNPIWGATITGATRARLAEFIRLNGPESVIAVATDGIIIDNPNPVVPPIPKPAVHDLGEWAEDTGMEGGVADCLMMMSGVYSLSGICAIKGEPKVKSTYRGNAALFIGGPNQPTSWADFCDLHSLKSLIVRDHENHPNARPYSVLEARQKGDYSLINVFRVVRASMKALGDSNKRLWLKERPQTFDDLRTGSYESSPHLTMPE